MNKNLVETYKSDKFKDETAGYIDTDGSFIYTEEYHGEQDNEYKNLGLPEFSSTHYEEDTCVRIYKEPNEIQYKKLEEIIDYFLNTYYYCKVEIWDKPNKNYSFYNVYSLFEGACKDYTWNEKVGNWTGYKLVQIIKNNINKKNLKEELLLELKRSQLINKSKNGASYALNNRKKGKNRFERRKYSRISTSIKGYNKIDMNAFWKGDILEVGIEVIGETDTYIVTLDFENILYNLKKEVKDNKNVFNFKVIYKALVKAFNDDDVYISCNCLHPDTKIKLLDGTCPTVAEMKTRFDAGEKLYVYSTDDKGDFKPGEVEKVWVTGEKTEFIKVTLDSGKEIITTPDHLYMLRDGSYIPAKDLTEGQSLMFTSIDETVSYFKLNHKVVKIERITLDSTPVYDIKVKDWENFVVEAGVVLHNCPDWKYRFGYVATKNKYSSQLPPELRPSNITNPKDDKGAGCKHTLLLLSNTGWLVKIASVIYNYVKYCKTNLSTNYKRYIFPQIYGMSYKQALDNQIFKEVDEEVSGLLPSDQKALDDVINRALKGRDEKGRFTKGNEYAFNKKDLRNLD